MYFKIAELLISVKQSFILLDFFYLATHQERQVKF